MESNMLNYIVARLKEPSTYAGLAGLALVVGITAEDWAAYSTIAIGIASGLAMLMSERGTPESGQ